MDWNVAQHLINRRFEDGLYRDTPLVASGYNQGSLISDLLRLRWRDLLSESITFTEGGYKF